ncbi:MAG: AfsR/SARP family transcriptional regulator, partial [Gaiellales bacterium]
FEELSRDGRDAAERGDASAAARRLAEALSCWRGPPLADFAFEPFARQAVTRLEELRLATLEERLDADLAVGRHADAVPELQELIAANPLRERPRGQLMLALYRSGRQAEALEVFQETRATLVEQLGIEPGPALQDLERSILQQSSLLDSDAELPGRDVAPAPSASRSILVAPEHDACFAALARLAEPLARSQVPHELVFTRLVPPGREAAGELADAATTMNALRTELAGRGVSARAAAFTSADPAADVVRIASEYEVDLLLTDTRLEQLADSTFSPAVSAILREAASDVAVLVDRGSGPVAPQEGRPVVVPFGGAEHDWAALELGAWLASASGVVLRLLGAIEGTSGGRDASRLLAHASLAVQGLVGVSTEPALAQPGEAGLLDAAAGCGLLVVGLSDSWLRDGIGPSRAAAARDAEPPMLLVRRGPRPGGLTAPENLTRYTWSLAGPIGSR